jgi:hypothetical protein
MDTPSHNTQSKKGKGREVSKSVPAQTTSQVLLGEHSDSRRLFCLVEGEAPPFIVAAPTNGNIDDLNQFVYKRGISGAEHSILAKDLVLLKVSPILHSGVDVDRSLFCALSGRH